MSRSKSKAAPTLAIHVSPNGNDRWSGQCAHPDRAKSDGPLRSLRAAQRAVRSLKKDLDQPRPIEVVLQGGTYFLNKALRFTAADSGWPADTNPKPGNTQRRTIPITWRAAAGQEVVISGGRALTGWEETTVNGRRAWQTTLPRKKETWWFQQLFADGQRRNRPRFPATGFYRLRDVPNPPTKPGWRAGTEAFNLQPGDFDPKWSNQQEIEIVTVQFWVESRMWVESYNDEDQLLTLDRKTTGRCLVSPDEKDGGTGYYIENVREGLKNPGQWYLDRSTGTVTYLPRKQETLDGTEVVAPLLSTMLVLEGTNNKPLEALHFENLTFSHTEWRFPDGQAGSNQAAWEVPAAVKLRHTRHCAFSHCSFTNLGTWGLGMYEGTEETTVAACDFIDNGAGGVIVWHGARRNRIEHCEIARAGRIFHSAIGVLVGRSSGNRICHNHIHDQYYSAMSIGWNWGYGEGDAYGNIVESNHIHNIGQAWLSDMGGIYTLGPSQGTRLRYNHIYDITSRGYGGWGIYMDEGSCDVLVENNLVHHCSRCPFNQHYGRDNQIVNNIFAYGREYGLTTARVEPHCSFIFERNIMVIAEGGAVGGGYFNKDWEAMQAHFNHNCWWHENGRKLDFCGHTPKQWQALGFDTQSRFANPGLTLGGKAGYQLKKTSQAFRTGFQLFDLRAVGPQR